MTTTRDWSSMQELFEGAGALLSGHFKLSSGLHSDQYFQCALLLCIPARAELLGQGIVDLVTGLDGFPKAETVVAPALGGLIIGHETARALGAKSLFVERQEDGTMALRRGFSLRPGEKVLVVEDVVTTGKSTREVIALLKGLGAEVVGAAAIVLRADPKPDLGVPLRALARLPSKGWTPETCPLCAKGVPLEKPGSRPI